MVSVAIGCLSTAARSSAGRAISPAEQDENAPIPKASRDNRRALAIGQAYRRGVLWANFWGALFRAQGQRRNASECEPFGPNPGRVVCLWMAAETLESLSALSTLLSEDE